MSPSVVPGRRVFWSDDYGTRYLILSHGETWLPFWGPNQAELEALAYVLLRVDTVRNMLRYAAKHDVRLARSRWCCSKCPGKSGDVNVPGKYETSSSSGVKPKVTGKQLINGRL